MLIPRNTAVIVSVNVLYWCPNTGTLVSALADYGRRKGTAKTRLCPMCNEVHEMKVAMANE